MPPLLTRDTETASQVTSCSKVFEIGCLPQIRGKITMSRPKPTITEPRRGSSKATLSPNGNRLALFYGFTENVGAPHLYSLAESD